MKKITARYYIIIRLIKPMIKKKKNFKKARDRKHVPYREA